MIMMIYSLKKTLRIMEKNKKQDPNLRMPVENTKTLFCDN